MRTDDTFLSGPSAGELTPLAVSQAALEAEENPSPTRMITPQERTASGLGYGNERRQSRIARFLLAPAVLGSAVAIGLGLMVLACAHPKKSRDISGDGAR